MGVRLLLRRRSAARARRRGRRDALRELRALYHKDYDPETGAIDSDHPFARLQRRVSKPGDVDPDADYPEKFVFGRTHLAVLVGVLMGVPAIYLYLLLDFSPMLRWMVVVVLGGGALGTFFVIDRVLQAEDLDYDASW